jgi:large subunit ribosomal protein L16
MLNPKQTKFKKAHKGTIKGLETKSNKVVFGKYGLKSVGYGRITARQIEATRVAIVRKVKKVSHKLWIRIFPDIPVTKKPAEVRMGKGKGPVEYWACRVKPGKMLFELSDINIELAKEAFKSGSSKLPILTKFVFSKNL